MPNCQQPRLPAGNEVVWLDDTDGTGGGPSPHERVLSIRNVATMFGVSRLTLCYYEFRGLIRRSNRLDGVRVYGWAACERLAIIIKCRRAGIPLRNLSVLIAGAEEDASPQARLMGREQCTGLIADVERRRVVLDEAVAELRHVLGLLTTPPSSHVDGARRD